MNKQLKLPTNNVITPKHKVQNVDNLNYHINTFLNYGLPVQTQNFMVVDWNSIVQPDWNVILKRVS